jgi:hypothetical protein
MSEIQDSGRKPEVLFTQLVLKTNVSFQNESVAPFMLDSNAPTPTFDKVTFMLEIQNGSRNRMQFQLLTVTMAKVFSVIAGNVRLSPFCRFMTTFSKNVNLYTGNNLQACKIVPSSTIK